jgi:hypothetical protein
LRIANRLAVAAIGDQGNTAGITDTGIDTAFRTALTVGELKLTFAGLATTVIDILNLPAKELFGGVIKHAELLAGAFQVIARARSVLPSADRSDTGEGRSRSNYSPQDRPSRP